MTPFKIKVIIADDVDMFRQGLRMMLQTEESIEIVGEASNGIEVFQLLQKQPADVVITDIQMPEMNGIELTADIKAMEYPAKVIALTMYEEDYLVVDMLEAGAKGYLLKMAGKDELIAAIHAVHAGGYSFCNSTSLKLMRKIAWSKADPFKDKKEVRLNDSERQIIKLICKEKSSREIADELQLGQKTIENYRNKIFEKTGTKNMAGLAIYAIRHGIFEP